MPLLFVREEKKTNREKDVHSITNHRGGGASSEIHHWMRGGRGRPRKRRVLCKHLFVQGSLLGLAKQVFDFKERGGEKAASLSDN